MPETQENNTFDGAEFQNGIERRQHLPGGSQKQEESIQSQTHRHVIDYSDVEVTTIGTPITIVVMSGSLEILQIMSVVCILPFPSTTMHRCVARRVDQIVFWALVIKIKIEQDTDLQEYNNKSADRLDQTELKSGLFTES